METKTRPQSGMENTYPTCPDGYDPDIELKGLRELEIENTESGDRL